MRSIVLGSDHRQRVRLLRMSIAGAIYLLSLAVLWSTVAYGWVTPATALAFSVFMVAGQLAFYAAIRSGFNLRFAEPALTMPQMIFAFVALAIGYRTNLHLRGSVLSIVTLVLVFSAFTLSPRRCRRLGWVAAAILLLAIAWGVVAEPARVDWRVEAANAVFALCILPTIAVLVGQLSQLRIDARRQRRELREAMELLRQHATQDELTGLPNRRHVQEWMAHEAGRRRRGAAPSSVAMIDLDHFKRVNDAHGHAYGDAVLRTFAQVARSASRDADILARWGGEEFVLVMPETPLDAAVLALERLRSRMADPAVWAACPLGRVTFSAGLAALAGEQTLGEGVEGADAALYEAKRLGRDRIVVHDVDAIAEAA